MNYRKLWLSMGIVIVASFAVLLYYGNDLYHKMPPIPAKVITAEGSVLYTKQEILDGQNVWQSAGGQQMGTVWGHGAYVAPDWSADWLHCESV
jgi:nitric oxide reductase subunit B